MITSRSQKLKAWKAYSFVRLEIDRNLKILKRLRDDVSNIYKQNQTEQQRQITDMLNSQEDNVPIQIQNLAWQSVPKWSYHGWESQIAPLALVLSDGQVKGVYDLQVLLEDVVCIHLKIGNLVKNYGDNARDSVLPLWDEWEKTTTRALQSGNPLKKARVIHKWLSIVGFNPFVKPL